MNLQNDTNFDLGAVGLSRYFDPVFELFGYEFLWRLFYDILCSHHISPYFVQAHIEVVKILKENLQSFEKYKIISYMTQYNNIKG